MFFVDDVVYNIMGLEKYKVRLAEKEPSGGGPENDYNISPRQWEILYGMMASDSSLGKQSEGNPFVITHMTNLAYLEWLDSELKHLSTGVEESTAGKSELSKKNRYTMRTVRHPDFDDLYWIDDSGDKLVPESIPFTPLTAKVWYSGDGCMSWNSKTESSSASFASSIEHNRSVISDKLQMLGLNPTITGNSVKLSAGETEQFIDWIGAATPGYEYKWEYESYDLYLRKRDKVE